MMNFKDAYRAANDEIHGDRSILAGINADKPKKIIYFKPAIGTAVAAAVCLVTVFAYPYITGTLQGNKEAPSKTSEDVMINSEQPEGLTVPGNGTAFGYARSVEMGDETETAENFTVDFTFTTSETQNNTEYTQRKQDDVSTKSTTPPINGNIKAVSPQNAVVVTEEAMQSKEKTAEEAALVDAAEETVTTENTAEVNAVPAPEATNNASAGGGGSNAAWRITSIDAGSSEITVNHPAEGEITLKITEKTVIVSTAGELLSQEVLQADAILESVAVAADGTAEKIIVK